MNWKNAPQQQQRSGPPPHGPGEVIEFKVLTKVGKFIIIEAATDEEAEYVKVGTVYVGQITPKP